jgi:hypothetical protein
MNRLTVRIFLPILTICLLGIPGFTWIGEGSQEDYYQAATSPGFMNPVLSWLTFLGSSNSDKGEAITVDGSGNVYVVGYSNKTWSTPVNSHAGGWDVLVVKLNSYGTYQWHTFLGSDDSDLGHGVAMGITCRCLYGRRRCLCS